VLFTGRPEQTRPTRTRYCFLQASSAAALIGLSFATAKFERVFDRLEMRELPLPTEGALALSRFVRWPPGLGLVLLAMASLIVLAQKGVLDPVLKKLFWANVLFLFPGVGCWVMSIFIPILKIQHSLEK